MKRFWLIMFALGLSTAFSATVFAADVKFSGNFYVAGMYVDQTDLRKTMATAPLSIFRDCASRRILLSLPA